MPHCCGSATSSPCTPHWACCWSRCATSNPRTAVTLAGCILLAFAAIRLLAASGGGGAEPPFDVQALAGYRGGPLDTLAAQLAIAPTFAVVTWIGQGPPALAMFLLGLAAGNAAYWRTPPPQPAGSRASN
jgi:hypothetical protein